MVLIPPEIEGFQIDFDAFEAAISEHTKSVVVNSPTTPPAWSTPGRRWSGWPPS